MPKEIELRRDLMVTVGYEIGPMLEGFSVVEVTIILSALFHQCFRGRTPEEKVALLKLFVDGLH